MIALLSLIPLVCLALWLFAEFRGYPLLRRVSGAAAMITIAIIGFIWGIFAESLRHMEFPIPADPPLPSEKASILPPPPPGPGQK